MQSSGLKKLQGTVESRAKAQGLTSGLELQAWCFPFPIELRESWAFLSVSANHPLSCPATRPQKLWTSLELLEAMYIHLPTFNEELSYPYLKELKKQTKSWKFRWAHLPWGCSRVLDSSSLAG